MVTLGKQVPDLSFDIFYKDDITKVSLSKYRGSWVVLYFYPADFTFVCPTELEEAADMYDEFKKAGAEIISISTDTAYVHKAWHDFSPKIKKIKYPMAADPTGTLCREFGTYIDDEGISLRGTFIIDPEGVLKSMDIHDNSIGRSSKEILRKLQAAIYVKEHDGEVCPASWHPGEKTLTPGMDLIGKL